MPASVRPDRLRITDFPDVAPTADIQADGMSNRWITALRHSARTVCLSFSAPLGPDTLAVIRALSSRVAEAAPPAAQKSGTLEHRVRMSEEVPAEVVCLVRAPATPPRWLNEARTRARYTNDHRPPAVRI